MWTIPGEIVITTTKLTTLTVAKKQNRKYTRMHQRGGLNPLSRQAVTHHLPFTTLFYQF